MKKKSNKIKGAVLKYTRYNPKYKYKVVYFNSKFFFTDFNKAKSFLKNSLLVAKIYHRKKNAKGIFQWKLLGSYKYSVRLNKVVKKGN